jgi:GH25 family lysozyme M1 (1,4-beta-N-acetylmuramidase)
MNIQEPNNLKTYAHIIDGAVVNVSLWDGESDWTPAEETVEIPEGVSAGIGWDYVDGKFVDNRPVEESLYV